MKRYKGEEAAGFRVLAYKDYIASRFLINNGFIHQGVVLASTSVEKYLKLLAKMKHTSIFGHLDNLEQLIDRLEKAGVEQVKEMDMSFLSILSTAFKLRYYDKPNTVPPIGFVVHQLLGELDNTVKKIEDGVRFFDAKDKELKGGFKTDWTSNSPHLIQNNYLFEGVPKKLYMEREGTCYMSFLFNGKEVTVSRKGVKLKYKGRICKFDDEDFPFRAQEDLAQ